MTKLFMHRHNHQPSSPPHNGNVFVKVVISHHHPRATALCLQCPSWNLMGHSSRWLYKIYQRPKTRPLVFGESHLTTFPNPKDQIQFRQNLSQRNPMELSHFTKMLTHRQEWLNSPPKSFLWTIVKREREYSNISKTGSITFQFERPPHPGCFAGKAGVYGDFQVAGVSFITTIDNLTSSMCICSDIETLISTMCICIDIETNMTETSIR